MSTTVTCHLCPSVIYGEDVAQVIVESDNHIATAHPDYVTTKESPNV